MRTLRLLLWLRWRLFLRSGTRSSRIGGALVTLLVLLAFSPGWLGGAIAAYAAVKRLGAPAIVVAYGVCQLMWVSLGILSGALVRTFDLDAFLRYPVRPRVVYAVNIGASLLSPVPLMTLPTLVAVTIAAAQRGGVLAAAGAALGGLAVLLVTAAFLQALLALLDEVLRHEGIRYAATGIMTLMLVAMQFGTRWFSQRLANGVLLRFAHHEITAREAVRLAGDAFRAVPTVAAPAAIAAGALDRAPLVAALGLAGTVVLLALGVLPGAALMRRTVRSGESASGPARPALPAGGAGSFGMGGRALPPAVALLLGRELRMTLRNPQRLMSVFIAPLVGLMFFFNSQGNPLAGAGFTLAMLASASGTSSQLLFAYDGPGVRSYFLLPCPPRELLVAKHLELLMRFVVQLALAIAVLVALSPRLASPFLFTMVLGTVALVLVSLAAGTTLSLKHPARARRRGFAMRGNTGWAGIVTSLGIFASAGLLAGAVWLARRLAGPSLADPAGFAVGTVALLAGAAVWWRSLDLNARLVVECRERLVDALARTEND